VGRDRSVIILKITCPFRHFLKLSETDTQGTICIFKKTKAFWIIGGAIGNLALHGLPPRPPLAEHIKERQQQNNYYKPRHAHAPRARKEFLESDSEWLAREWGWVHAVAPSAAAIVATRRALFESMVIVPRRAEHLKHFPPSHG
jgi:hypothetical protein